MSTTAIPEHKKWLLTSGDDISKTKSTSLTRHRRNNVWKLLTLFFWDDVPQFPRLFDFVHFAFIYLVRVVITLVALLTTNVMLFHWATLQANWLTDWLSKSLFICIFLLASNKRSNFICLSKLTYSCDVWADILLLLLLLYLVRHFAFMCLRIYVYMHAEKGRERERRRVTVSERQNAKR